MYNVVVSHSTYDKQYDRLESYEEAVLMAKEDSEDNFGVMIYVEESNPDDPQLRIGKVLIAFLNGEEINYYSKNN